MRYPTRISKLVKRIEKFDKITGKSEIVDNEVYAFPKDVDKYLKLGYKNVSDENVLKNFTGQQKAYYLDGDESQKRVVVTATPEEIAAKRFEADIMNMTSDELQELVEQYNLDVVLGTFEKVVDKKAAVLRALKNQEAESAKESEVKKEISGEADIRKKLKNMTVAEIEAFVEESGIDITLSNYSKKAEKINAVVDIMVNKG